MFAANFDDTGVETYADALAYFERAKPWRGETDITDERPMEHRRHRNYGVRNDAGVIRFRLHRTDVVSYHPDGTIEFDVYSSPTTDSFVNSLVDWSVRSYFVSGYMVIDGLAYRAVDYVTIRPDRSVSTTQKWSKYKVDRKQMNAAIREYAPNLPDAVEWLRAAEALGVLGVNFGYHSLDQRLEALKDRAKWKHMTPETVEALREDLARAYALEATDPLDGIPPREIESYRQAWRKWGKPQVCRTR